MGLDKLWTLVAKKLAGEASEEELKEMEELIREHPGWQNAIEQIEQLWKQQPMVQPQDIEDAYIAHLYRLEEKKININAAPDSPQTERRIGGKQWWWIAAASVLIILSLFLYNNDDTGSRKELKPQVGVVSEVSTKPQSKSRLQLPDGSTVWLNAGSKLTYAPDFGKTNREVELVGEAFFDVVKMPAKPFIINTTNIQIKVLGTAFNVKAYKGDKVTETSLVRGRIEVTIRNRPEKKIVLTPFEKLIVENDALATRQAVVQRDRKLYSIIDIQPRPTDSSIVETSWIQDELIFREERFEDLARMMEIRFKVEIEVRNTKLKDLKFSGIWKDESIEKALEALQFSVPFEYRIMNEHIIIY
jgi:ferric-dicitrate binding protein FerR (iron transport regulator)